MNAMVATLATLGIALFLLTWWQIGIKDTLITFGIWAAIFLIGFFIAVFWEWILR